MKKVRYISWALGVRCWLLAVGCWMLALTASAQAYNQIDEEGSITRRNEGNGNFNKHNNDTTKKKQEVPQGIYVWAIDRRFGDVRPTLPDTVSHLFMNTTFNTGIYGEYNTTGNNYTPRESRIFIDRPETDQFIFTQPYSWFMKQPQDFHFVNTLSPYTNITYDNCGDKQHGEDHIDAKFAVNANKQLGFGFDLNYAYASGYYGNQAASHFCGTLFASYLGDRYQMHALLSAYHQKVTENGGIIDDNFITHPENNASSLSEEEIPTVLSSNWNRNDNQHILFSHRYNVGFYRKVPLTPEEIKARKFAQESKKAREAKEEGDITGKPLGRPDDARPVAPAGRPDGATIAGDLPAGSTIPVLSDTSRIVVDSHEKRDSLLAIQARQDSIDATMKDEFVPVTSFIHTLDINNYRRSYLAYATPQDFYANSYYDMTDELTHSGDSINDQTKFLSVKNTFAIALLEGFNKYAKAGVKVFASHELRRFQLPDSVPGQTYYTMGRWNENTVSVGGQIIKTQGRTLHYNLAAEAWLVGADAGKLTLDFSTDLNFPLFGDTVRLAASAFLHRLKPTFYQSHYHSKHIWWDNEDLSSETRLRVEGLFSYPKTKTMLRVAVEEVKNYTYFGMSYNATTDGRTKMSANLLQETGNINVLTAQLKQDFRLGILNWENVVTYQNSSNKEVLPLPALNLFSNLYLKFKVVKQLTFEIGGDISFFTKYDVPDYCPQLGQFAIQQNADSRVELGGYPYVDVYANMHLKKTRFFIMYSHITAGSGDRNYFLTPHYPTNSGTLHFGVSWNFIN